MDTYTPFLLEATRFFSCYTWVLTDDYDHDVNDPDFTADRNESDSDDTSNDLSYNDEQVV